jgi:hypothetical protein
MMNTFFCLLPLRQPAGIESQSGLAFSERRSLDKPKQFSRSYPAKN